MTKFICGFLVILIVLCSGCTTYAQNGSHTPWYAEYQREPVHETLNNIVRYANYINSVKYYARLRRAEQDTTLTPTLN